VDAGEGGGGSARFAVSEKGREIRVMLTVAQLVYLDFKPKIYKTGNDTVEYKVKTCD
jgi:hypothetical protein